MNFEHKSIPLSKVAFDDYSFCFSYPCRASKLLDSIDLVGIIHPPVLRKRGGSFQIVCGRGRLRAAQQLGVPEVLCKVLPGWIDDLTCLIISLEENLTSRAFNIIEQALVVEKFLHYLPESKVIQTILPRLGYKPAYKHFQFLLSLNFLEEEVKELLVQGLLSPQVGVRLLDLQEEDRRELVKLFKLLRPGVNRQRQILDYLSDLARRDECPLRKFLHDPRVQEILASERLNPPQKTERLCAYWRRCLLPHLVLREEAFRKEVGRLQGPGIRVLPSQAFEKDFHLLQVEFQDLDDLRKKWSDLGQKLKVS